MAQITELRADNRPRTGKGAARAIRREGRVPAVIYGDKKDPQTISLGYHELFKQVQTGNFLSTVFMINVDGEKTRVLPRDLQFDIVRDFPIHADFLRISKDATVTVEISMNFINEEECEGLTRGGVLNVVRHAIELNCPATAIPESIDADLTGLDIGDTLHASDLKLPEGVTLTIDDRDFTVATIAAPSEVETEEEEEEELEGEEGLEGEEAEEAGEEGGEE